MNRGQSGDPLCISCGGIGLVQWKCEGICEALYSVIFGSLHQDDELSRYIYQTEHIQPHNYIEDKEA